MKRLWLRMAAVVCLSGLGLIAMGYAQRGGPEAAAGNDAVASPLRGAASEAPRRLPEPIHANPLRPRQIYPEAVPTAANLPAADAAPRPSLPGKAPPGAPLAADPFGLRPPAPREAVPPAAAPILAPPALAPAAPSAVMADSRAAVTSPPRTTNSATAGRGFTEAGASDSRAAAKAAEPAPFRLDTSVPSSSLHRPAPEREAAPPATPREAVAGGTGKPGAPQLEGPQSPQLTLQKFAPKEVQVGKPATFRTTVRNIGSMPAQHVEIRDDVPRGARLLKTSPAASQGVRGELVWTLGTLRPGEETAVELVVMPLEEGEMGSVASVRFQADATARTMATKPQLLLKVSGPKRVLMGEPVPLTITVTNTGSGVARKVVLAERVPAGLHFEAGNELEYEVGDLKPNEFRELELKLTAAQPGPVTNVLVARDDATLKVEDRLQIEIVAPQLDLAVEGPKHRFLEREATYTLAVSNPGTAPARQVQLVAYLPNGMKFVTANNAGQYDESTRTVRWLLEELPTRETAPVSLTAVPTEAGEHTLKVRSTAERGLAVEKEQPVVVEGIAALMFEVRDGHDPVEVGGETTYEIRVLNQGSKDATNVRVNVLLPAEMRLLAAEGASRQSGEAGTIAFEPLPRLGPKADAVYRLRLKCLRPGDLRVRVQLAADDIRLPITKEESTRAYADE